MLQSCSYYCKVICDACCEFIFSCNHTVMSKEKHRERREHATIRRCEDKAQLCTHVINYKDWPWSHTKPLRLIELAELSESGLRLSLAPHLCNHWNACNIYLHGYWELFHTYRFSSLNGTAICIFIVENFSILTVLVAWMELSDDPVTRS